MAKRSARQRKTRSSRSGASSNENVRPLRSEDFNRRPATQRDYTFSSFFEDEDSYAQERAYARSRSSSQGRSASRSTGAVRGRRSGAIIQKKTTSKARAFALPQREESDFTIIACVIMLSVIGLIMVTSASYYYAYTQMGNSMYFFRRQLLWLIVGLAAMFGTMKLPFLNLLNKPVLLKRVAQIVYAVSLRCCIAVLFFGSNINGSTRWLDLGFLSFQPAELAKFGVALYMSVLVEEHQKDITKAEVFAKLFVVVCIPTALVAYQNLSSGIIIAAIGMIIMFVGGARWKHFFCIVGPIFALIVLVVVLPMLIDIERLPQALQGFMQEFLYRTERVQAWLDPFAYAQDEGFQTVQSLYAVGSGGLLGRGLGQSIQKLGFIPEAHNDIIFSIICEELGLFGAGIVILLFGIFVWHGIKISLFAPNKFTSLLAVGIVGQIGLQAILNIAVNTNSIPATGITLPFISYGGSSMLFLMISVGILLNISSYTRKTSAS